MTLVLGAMENCHCFSTQNEQNNKLGEKSPDPWILKVWSGKSTNESLDAGLSVHLIHSFIQCDSVNPHQWLLPRQALVLQNNMGHVQRLEGNN